MIDTFQIRTGLKILNCLLPPGLHKQGRARARGRYLLVVARLIDVIDNSESGVELFVNFLSYGSTSLRIISQSACSSNVSVIVVSDVVVIVEELVLVN